jgi:transposase
VDTQAAEHAQESNAIRRDRAVNYFKGDKTMEVIYERCCGLDIHKTSIVACVIVGGEKEIRTFGTMTDDLLQMAAYLRECEVEMTAMESTGSFWKPIFNILEVEGIAAILVNAAHIKAVPGRKTDVKDAEWIARCLKYGLLRASYVKPRDQRELCELIRYRVSLIEERAREYNRMGKVLEGANIKLTSVASKMDTVSGMNMIRALINGVVDPALLASLAKGRMRSKKDELKRAMNGLIQPHQRMLLKAMLGHIEQLSQSIRELDAEIEERMGQDVELIEALDEITGVGKVSAQTILAEIGTDMSHFPSANHLSSWACMSPGHNESAGKKKSGRTQRSNSTLKKTLVQCGRAAANSKDTYLGALYHRIAARRGAKRAAVAVGHAILVICYHMIQNRTHYNDLGATYFQKRNRDALVKQNVKRLQALGFNVVLEEIA